MKNNVSIKILGEDMKRILHAVEAWMDDFKIKNKFYILYILCVLVPLIVTDSAVFSVVMKSEREARERILPMQLHTVFQIRSTMQQRSGRVFIRANILTVFWRIPTAIRWTMW